MDSNFELGEINKNAASRLASQVVIPRLRAEVFPAQSSEPFKLRDDIYSILKDEVVKGNLTQEQLDATCHITPNGVNHSLAATTRWYVVNMLRRSGAILSSDARGFFILTDAGVIEEEEDEEVDDVEIAIGSIYAYTFPSLKSTLIKIGMASGNVEDRINKQLGTANPEAPVILHIWSETDIGVMETAIHSILKARGKWVDAPRAKEWFRTTIEEVDSIIKFVKEG